MPLLYQTRIRMYVVFTTEPTNAFHLPKRSFKAILIDSVAMPGVIFE